MRSLLYFHVVRLAPRKLHREHVDGEVGFDLDDMVIAPHRVLHIDAERRRVFVEVSSLDYTTSISTQPFVLSLSTFSPEQLLDLRQWQMEDELMYNIWDCAVLERLPLAPVSARFMPGVIKDLLERHSENGASFDSRHSEFAHHISVLASLEDAGCIKQQARDARYSTWKLTPDGYGTIKPGFHLHDPSRSLIERKGIVLAERSIWELIVCWTKADGATL